VKARLLPREINISQNAKKVLFVGTFATGGLDVAIADGRLTIERDGSTRKFVHAVEHRMFSGTYAAKAHKHVRYIPSDVFSDSRRTEWSLLEIAPGVDLERDIL